MLSFSLNSLINTGTQLDQSHTPGTFNFVILQADVEKAFDKTRVWHMCDALRFVNVPGDIAFFGDSGTHGRGDACFFGGL